LKVRFLEDGGKLNDAIAKGEQGARGCRVRLKKSEVLKCGFAESYAGCGAILNGTAQRGHSELCRARILITINKINSKRIEEQEMKESEQIAKEMERRLGDDDIEWIAKLREEDRERVKTSLRQAPSSSSSSGGPTVPKRVLDDGVVPGSEQEGGGG
jgi:hypothetical protein